MKELMLFLLSHPFKVFIIVAGVAVFAVCVQKIHDDDYNTGYRDGQVAGIENRWRY